MRRNQITFGKDLVRLRREKGITPHELAKELGCTFLYLRELEWGARKAPRMDLFEKLIDVLGASDQADRMARLAARGRPKLAIDTSELPFDRVLLAIQFLRKLRRLRDADVSILSTVLMTAG